MKVDHRAVWAGRWWFGLRRSKLQGCGEAGAGLLSLLILLILPTSQELLGEELSSSKMDLRILYNVACSDSLDVTADYVGCVRMFWKDQKMHDEC